MNVLSIWPIIPIAGAIIVTAQLCLLHPFYDTLLRKQSGAARVNTLDGLRGFLAFSVFFTHTESTYFFNFYQRMIPWRWPPRHFYVLLGEVPVVVFFLITGYLFWDKALRRQIRWRRHYLGRFLRITPVYWLLVLLAMTCVLTQTGLHNLEPWNKLFAKLSTIAVPGGYSIDSTFNGVSLTELLAATWTLRYELVFYAVLPLLAGIGNRISVLAIGALACAGYWAQGHWRSIAPLGLSRDAWILFFFGMAICYVLPIARRARMIGRLADFVVIAGICLLFWWPIKSAYSLPCSVLVSGVLALIIAGVDLFGLLVLPVSRFLGTVSYSVYLLHVPVLWLVFRLHNGWEPIENWDAAQYWQTVGVAGILVTLVSSITYRYLEYPFLRLPPSKVEMQRSTTAG